MPAHPSQFAPPFQVNQKHAIQQPYDYQNAPGKQPGFPAHPSSTQWQQHQMARSSAPPGPTASSNYPQPSFPQVGSSHNSGLANGHHANDLSSAGHQVSKSENVNGSSNENKNSVDSEQTSVNGVHSNSTSRPNYNIQQSTPTPPTQNFKPQQPPQQYQYHQQPEQQPSNQFPPQHPSFPPTSQPQTYAPQVKCQLSIRLNSEIYF